MHTIKIETDPALSGLKDNHISKIINHVLENEGESNSEITVVFTNESLIQKLKKEFFNLDKPTDVIAFRLNDYDDANIEGEIYICLPVAKKNADYYKEPYEREIARLIIHGCLHLIGYIDDAESERLEMQKLENNYLKELGI